MVTGVNGAPQFIVTGAGAIITGIIAGFTVMVRETGARFLPQPSVAVHVSVMVPPHAPGIAVIVERLEVPDMEHPPLNPLLKGRELAPGTVPHETVMFPGLDMAGNVAGFTVIVLDTGVSALPQTSVAVQVSVTVPPQAPGVAVNVDVFDVPEIRHPPLKPLLKLIVLGAGTAPQSNVSEVGAVMVGMAAGLTVMVLVIESRTLPQPSVAVHVSVTVPPQEPGIVENVDTFDVPIIRHPPLNPLLYGRALAAGMVPQATVMSPGFEIAGIAAGFTVIFLETGVNTLPQPSVAVQVSVTKPPQAPGVGVKVDALDVPVMAQFPVRPLL